MVIVSVADLADLDHVSLVFESLHTLYTALHNESYIERIPPWRTMKYLKL